MRTDEGTFSTLHAYFTWDHDRLDQVLADVGSALAHGDAPRAEETLTHYERGLRRHIRIEEEIVFQEYALEGSASAGLIPPIVREHAEILRDVDELRAAVAASDVDRFRALQDRLFTILAAHRGKEEETLYPLLDSLLGPRDAEKLVARLRAE